MSTAAQPFPANVPLVDAAGTISPVWLRFFLSIWTRTGSSGAGGIIIPDTSILAAAMGDVPDVAPDDPAAVAALMADVPDPPVCDPLLAAGLWADAPDVSCVDPMMAAALWADPGDATIPGKYLSSPVLLGAAVSLTSGTTANVTSLLLTAGDWDVFANVGWSIGAGASATSVTAAISTVSATTPSPNNGSTATAIGTFTSSGSPVQPTGIARVVVATTTTVYLVTNASFSGGTAAAFGMLQARSR